MCDFDASGDVAVLPRVGSDALLSEERIAARADIHDGGFEVFTGLAALRRGDCGPSFSGETDEGVDCLSGEVDGVTLFVRDVDGAGARGEFGRRKGDAREVPLKERGEGLYVVGVGGEDYFELDFGPRCCRLV